MTLLSAIEDYVSLRRTLGAEFSSAAKMLRAFGRAVGDVSVDTISTDHCTSFCRGRDSGRRYQWEKHTMLNVFFRYLLGRGHIVSSPLPDPPRREQSDFRPYIFSHAELQRLLDWIPRLCCNRRWRLEPITLRTLLLLLYGTGLRVGEALSLRCCDVDLSKRLLSIWDTKFFKSRLVPIGAALCDLLATYLAERQRVSLVEGDHSPFFVFRTGKPVSYASVRAAFAQLRERADVRRPPRERWRPRIHDLRATFAVHRLLAWYREGVDVQARLPLLATYLGHTSMSGTAYYLTMTPELLRVAGEHFENYALQREEKKNEV